MKILAVSLDYPPTVGGISAHVFELYQAMRQLGHEVTILTKKHADYANPTQMVDGVRVMPLPPRFFGPTYGRTINRALLTASVLETQADIVHLHGMRPLEFLKLKPVPIIYTNHTSGFLKRLEKGGYRIPRMKSLFAPVDMFLAPSEELLELPFDDKRRQEIYFKRHCAGTLYPRRKPKAASARRAWIGRDRQAGHCDTATGR